LEAPEDTDPPPLSFLPQYRAYPGGAEGEVFPGEIDSKKYFSCGQIYATSACIEFSYLVLGIILGYDPN
jgi:hypothetical protein